MVAMPSPVARFVGLLALTMAACSNARAPVAPAAADPAPPGARTTLDQEIVEACEAGRRARAEGGSEPPQPPCPYRRVANRAMIAAGIGVAAAGPPLALAGVLTLPNACLPGGPCPVGPLPIFFFASVAVHEIIGVSLMVAGATNHHYELPKPRRRSLAPSFDGSTLSLRF